MAFSLPSDPADIEHDLHEFRHLAETLQAAAQHPAFAEYFNEHERREVVQSCLELIAILRARQPNPVVSLQARRANLRSAPL